ncbi:hypothetical protein C8Q74DRAFT_1215679 [Fomes fomentarius]|nr:hypothetical protein C8Q74DRAFT_1215679 [Fomes fomentarius]
MNMSEPAFTHLLFALPLPAFEGKSFGLHNCGNRGVSTPIWQWFKRYCARCVTLLSDPPLPGWDHQLAAIDSKLFNDPRKVYETLSEMFNIHTGLQGAFARNLNLRRSEKAQVDRLIARCGPLANAPLSETIIQAQFAEILPTIISECGAERKEKLAEFFFPYVGGVSPDVDPLTSSAQGHYQTDTKDLYKLKTEMRRSGDWEMEACVPFHLRLYPEGRMYYTLRKTSNVASIAFTACSEYWFDNDDRRAPPNTGARRMGVRARGQDMMEVVRKLEEEANLGREAWEPLGMFVVFSME